MQKSEKKNNNDFGLVSIIIRTCNRRHLLPRAIESVYSQSYPNVEIVIVNDAGEEIEDIIKHYRDLPQQDGLKRKIQYVYNNASQLRAGSANVGLRMANGKYIGFLDDDDYYMHNHIQKHVSAMVKNDVKFSISKAVESIENKGIEVKKTYSMPLHINKFYFYFFGNIYPINTVMFQSDITDEIGLFDVSLKALEDWDFFIRLFLNCGDPAYIDYITTAFTTETDGKRNTRVSLKDSSKWMDAYKHVQKKLKTYYQDKNASVPLSMLDESIYAHSLDFYHFNRSYNHVVHEMNLLKKENNLLKDEIKKYKDSAMYKMYNSFLYRAFKLLLYPIIAVKRRLNRYTNIK